MLVKSFIDGIHFYKTHPQQSIASFAKFLKLNDPSIVTPGYYEYTRFYQEAPYPSKAAIQSVLDAMRGDERIRKFRPEEFIDSGILKEFERSGYVRSLYGR